MPVSNHLKLEAVDIDGAIREQAEDLGLDRADFFRKAGIAGAGVVAGGALFGPFLANAEAAISSRRSKANDVKILNFALTLEFLEAEFYKQAVDKRTFKSPEVEAFARTVARHEAQHVTFLRKALGSKAVKKPTFDFADTVTNVDKFMATSQVLEDTGVRAYLGQAGNIAQRAVLGAAGTIVTVEARHAAWIRFLNGGGAFGASRSSQPAPATFDTPASERAILRAVGATGFIKG
jgi:rubrerythrin